MLYIGKWLSKINWKYKKMLNTILALAGIVQNYATGIHSSKKIERLLQNQRCLAGKIEKLSENIYYLPDIQMVKDINLSIPKIVSDLREVREALEPIQTLLGTKIVSSGMIITPEKMRSAILKNPWEVLIDIRPASFSHLHVNSDIVPIMFEYDGTRYIGWQMKGTMPLLFNCEYNEDIFLWVQKRHSQKNIIEKKLRSRVQYLKSDFKKYSRKDLFEVFVYEAKKIGFKRWKKRKGWVLYSKDYPKIRFRVWETLINLETRPPYYRNLGRYHTLKEIKLLIGALSNFNSYLMDRET